jgi:hypothetical protein
MATKQKTLYMETTTVPASRTAAEVSAELIQAGATQIATSYDNGRVVGLRWTMKVHGIDALFEMPARVEPMYRLFCKRKGWRTHTTAGAISSLDLWEKSERVAWRQLLRWVQAQNAMIETGMVQPMEVFTAYWIPPGQDQTLFDSIISKQFKALPPPREQ